MLLAIPMVVIVKESVMFAIDRFGFGLDAAPGPAPATMHAELPARVAEQPGLRPER